MNPRRAFAGYAVDLAVFRVVVAALLLVSPEVHAAPGHADLPWLGQLGRAGVCLGAALGLLGVRARAGFALAAICGVWLLGLPHAAGVGLHNHHLVWFAALLALSPCADALAWGRWRARPAPSAIYGAPLWAAWLLLAAIYAWPGAWKLALSGADWLSGDVLRSHLRWKLAQSWTFTPLFAVEQTPALLTVGAIASVAFELSAPLLIVTGRGRVLFAVAALIFHGLTAALLDVRFGSLWPCLAVLLPWHRWLGPAPAPRAAPDSPPWPRTALTAALVLAVWIAGARGETRGWPLACYPTFAEPARATMPTLLVVVDGRDVPLQRYAEPSPQLWAEVWRLIGIGGPVDPAALEAFWRRHHPRPAGAVQFYRAEMSVAPDQSQRPPRRIRLLHSARF